jgi:hypothetical protein
MIIMTLLLLLSNLDTERMTMFLIFRYKKPILPVRPRLKYPIYEIGGCCKPVKKKHDDDCMLICFNQAIESDYLKWRWMW